MEHDSSREGCDLFMGRAPFSRFFLFSQAGVVFVLETTFGSFFEIVGSTLSVSVALVPNLHIPYFFFFPTPSAAVFAFFFCLRFYLFSLSVLGWFLKVFLDPLPPSRDHFFFPLQGMGILLLQGPSFFLLCRPVPGFKAFPLSRPHFSWHRFALVHDAEFS